MINTSSWALQYLVIAFVALFAGPVLSKLPAAQTFPLTFFELTGAQTIRLVIEETGLILLCIMSIRAFRHMPDNGKGSSFLRQLVLPVTALFVLIATDKTLRVAGISLIDHVGPRHYTLAYTASLMTAGIWITAAWLLNLDALTAFFLNPRLPRYNQACQRMSRTALTCSQPATMMCHLPPLFSMETEDLPPRSAAIKS